MEALLKVNDISMVFGGLRAVSNFSMEIKAGELIGLIGPNGAGKTTAFNMRDTLKEARSRALLNRASTVVCTSLSKSASAVTQDGCGANLTNYATTMSASLKKDSVFVVNVEKKINVKMDTDMSVIITQIRFSQKNSP